MRGPLAALRPAFRSADRPQWVGSTNWLCQSADVQSPSNSWRVGKVSSTLETGRWARETTVRRNGRNVADTGEFRLGPAPTANAALPALAQQRWPSLRVSQRQQGERFHRRKADPQVERPESRRPWSAVDDPNPPSGLLQSSRTSSRHLLVSFLRSGRPGSHTPGHLLTFTVTGWATAPDWVRPFGFGGRMSAVAGTGRSGLGQAADRSTLELDVRDTPTCSRPNLPQPSASQRLLPTGSNWRCRPTPVAQRFQFTSAKQPVISASRFLRNLAPERRRRSRSLM